jgi:hypothetical protein
MTSVPSLSLTFSELFLGFSIMIIGEVSQFGPYLLTTLELSFTILICFKYKPWVQRQKKCFFEAKYYICCEKALMTEPLWTEVR